MTFEEKIHSINQVVQHYFNINNERMIPAKDLMPYFVQKGIFNKDHKNGLPIRQVLRKLDVENQIHLIPAVYAERKTKNTKWFFLKGSPPPPVAKKEIKKEATAKKKAIKRQGSDEHYVLDICDALLDTKASRQHKFDFLLGDPGKNGSKRKLPVDAYYEKFNLVIEYRERQHSEIVSIFDKPDVKTISGVSRGEQRKIYDQRRRDVLKEKRIMLIEIDYSQFSFNSQKKIIRNPKVDKVIIKKVLATVIKNI